MADQWSTGLNVGDVINYVSETGATAALELRSREDSEPYVGSTNNGAEVVECGTTSFRQYVFENSDVALQISINETRLEDLADNTGQIFQLRITPQSPIGERVAPGYSFGFSLAEQARQQYTSEFVLDAGSETRFIENLQIGNNSYPYAVERKYADLTLVTNAVTNPNSLAAITRVVVAEGGGMVQFELLNGEIYSRI